ncbi:MAG: OadG family transporter subunit [SAR202 cluster bacterium]|jgi:Na+-transporting methylmalonyl-CoA/oxaloacetate decarboxylase gamma subunit|nr:OadG family transporter subunit [SAR202 cluster bacterium]MDP6665559.1 OadG family transporter subunit [SAR202 cluster bacterium]MDP6799200.1 OadG family transporter subunit [SAR202 cluster bacterium]|tara:strand:+ start:2049 stop:2342 length:294 start_codon:yes stop_codon:yes gene_type:complete
MPLLLAPAVAEEAWILTAIGIGTAFAVLLILLVIVAIVRLFTAKVAPRFGWEAVAVPVAEAGPSDAESRNRALAAALAVTALLESKSEPPPASRDNG